MTNKLRASMIALGVAASAVAAQAQDAFLGQPEFQERCSICHGSEGAGDGAVGELFAQRPKDLRLLAKENGGAFPFSRVYESIDGRQEVAAHGTEMPIWGDYLMVEALESRNVNPKDARMVVEARILALVNFIQSLQVE